MHLHIILERGVGVYLGIKKEREEHIFENRVINPWYSLGESLVTAPSGNFLRNKLMTRLLKRVTKEVRSNQDKVGHQ